MFCVCISCTCQKKMNLSLNNNFMQKRFKTVGMMLFLLGGLTGTGYAASPKAVDDVRITQQSETCAGVVKDATGEAVIGASVVVKGTTNGTITDFDGNSH